MSPLIDLQRRLVQVGRIRMGERNDRGHPTRLGNWKLTSRDRVRLDAAALVYGGTVAPWDGHDGEYALHTEVDSLPILLMPGQAISQAYELWSGGGCKRRCDGETEQLTDSSCLCDPEARECKPHTRLNVLLQEVPGIGCWRLDTSGYYAATELAGTVDLLELATTQGALLPARLRIDQRVQVRDGQTKRYPVPVVDIDILPLEMVAIARSAGAGEIVAAKPELPPGYKPLSPAQTPAGVTVREALEATARGAEPRAQTGRSAAPMGPVGEFASDAPMEAPGEPQVPGDAPASGTEPVATDVKGEGPTGAAASADSGTASDAQKKKLNVLVGSLREAGHITTEQLYTAVGADPDAAPRGEDGLLHWAPLRDGLTKEQASDLIERLQRFETNLQTEEKA